MTLIQNLIFVDLNLPYDILLQNMKLQMYVIILKNRKLKNNINKNSKKCCFVNDLRSCNRNISKSLVFSETLSVLNGSLRIILYYIHT